MKQINLKISDEIFEMWAMLPRGKGKMLEDAIRKAAEEFKKTMNTPAPVIV